LGEQDHTLLSDARRNSLDASHGIRFHIHRVI
jgi:hypothetical protein